MRDRHIQSLNSEQSADECDATMLKIDIQPGSKKIIETEQWQKKII